MDRHREEKAHVPPLVHDRGPTVRTRHFGGKLVLGRLAIRGIECQAIRPIGKRNVRFREDGSPLKGCTWRNRPSESGYHLTFLPREGLSHTMHYLTSSTMAIFSLQWLLPVQLVGDPATVASAFPLHFAKLVARDHAIRRSRLPFQFLRVFFDRAQADAGIG